MKPNSIYRYIVVLLVAQLLAGQAMAEVYRWKDKDGNVHFSDKPQTDDAQPVKINPENKQRASANSNKQPAKSVQEIADEMQAARLEREKVRKASGAGRDESAASARCRQELEQIKALQQELHEIASTYSRFTASDFERAKPKKRELEKRQKKYNQYCR